MSSLAKSQIREFAAPAADLDLEFVSAPDNRTYLGRQFGRYPYHVCRAQYLDSNPVGLATVYLQSSSGGIFEGDCLRCDLWSQAGARAHITTQASTIVHRMERGSATQCVNIYAAEDSLIEYLPDPVILFPESQLHSTVNITQHPNSAVIICDGFTHHDPNENQEMFRSYFSEIRHENLSGELQFLDRYQIFGEDLRLPSLGVMGKGSIQSTLSILANSLSIDGLLEALRSDIKESFSGYAGASLLPNRSGIIVRLLCNEMYQMKSCILGLWGIARSHITGYLPALRRK